MADRRLAAVLATTSGLALEVDETLERHDWLTILAVLAHRAARSIAPLRSPGPEAAELLRDAAALVVNVRARSPGGGGGHPPA